MFEFEQALRQECATVAVQHITAHRAQEPETQIAQVTEVCNFEGEQACVQASVRDRETHRRAPSSGS